MKYSSLIDNVTAIEWGLTIQLAYLFDWVYSLPSWASSITIDGITYYFASKALAIKEMPLLTEKVDTMYRYYKQLEEKGLIILTKADGKDYIALTRKAKDWNKKVGKKSEHSEINPSIVGNKSENGSENNPTYKITNTNQITNEKSLSTSVDNLLNDFPTVVKSTLEIIRSIKSKTSGTKIREYKITPEREGFVKKRMEEFKKLWPGRNFNRACQYAFEYKAKEWFGTDMWRYFDPEILLGKKFVKYLEKAEQDKGEPYTADPKKEEKVKYTIPK